MCIHCTTKKSLYQLEALLCHLEVLAIGVPLTDGCVHDSLNDVFLRGGGLQIAHQLEGLVHRVVTQVVDDLKHNISNDLLSFINKIRFCPPG